MVRSYVEKLTKILQHLMLLNLQGKWIHQAQLYTILELCRSFDKIFKEHLDGGCNVRKIVSEADGYQPHLIAPELGYRRLIEGSLNYFRDPAEASVDAVRIETFSQLCNQPYLGHRTRNIIPKAVVYCQVKEDKQNLLNYFSTCIFERESRKQLAELLDEDPALMEKRQQCAKRLELYKKARDEIDSVSWISDDH
ncbi:hypothetical protein CASFOL_031218 [Castilleja foliolosa]|uniref:GED domain-containing protein n=1 Tax=Castilleja foliolosa TaxID=1961234 RepID=A0ABD3C6V2_9LAMI